MDIKQLLEKLDVEPIDINVSNDYDVLLKNYKGLAEKYILTAERTMYNSLKSKNMIKLCQTENSFVMLNDFIHGIFTFNIGYGIDKNSKELIQAIIDINDDDKMSVLKKTFKIIDAFYSSIDREKLRLDELEHYQKDILEQFEDYVQLYMEDIIALISDNKPMDETMTYNLSCVVN